MHMVLTIYSNMLPSALLLLAAVVLFLLLLIRILLGRISVSRLEQRAVLITGCDSGFGFELALRCLRARMRVFAACLTEQGIEALRKTALEQVLTIEKLKAFEMDVRSDQSVMEGLKFVEEKLGPGKGIHALVNNAGITGNSCWDDWLVPDDYEAVWQVNTLGTIRVTQSFKNLVKCESDSRIVFMVAGCGRFAFPALGPYTVSKFALQGYCDTIRTELLLFGVRVSIIEPGFFRTPMTNRARVSAVLDKLWARLPDTVKRDYGVPFFEFSKYFTFNFLDPAKLNHPKIVTDACWHAVSSTWPRRRYKVGMDVKWVIIPLSLLPAEFQDLLYKIILFFTKMPLPKSSLLH